MMGQPKVIATDGIAATDALTMTTVRQPAPIITLKQDVIEALPRAAKGKRDTYRFDSDTLTGVELRVTDKGTKTFRLMVRGPDGGKPQCPTLGKFGKLPQELRTVEAVKEKLAKVRAQLARDENPADEKRRRRAELTVTKAYEAYKDAAIIAKKKSAGAEVTLYNNHIKGAIGSLRLSEVTRERVRELHATVSAAESSRKGRSDRLRRTANQVVQLLSVVFAWYDFDENPAKGIKRNRETARSRYIQEDEAPLFSEALELLSNATMRDFFLLCLYTGARRGNVLAMRWTCLDMQKMKWSIPAAESKSGEDQVVSLAPEASDIIEARRAAVDESGSIQQFVFPSTGKSGHIEEPKKAWKRVCDGMQVIEMLHAMFPSESERSERDQWKERLRDNFAAAKKQFLGVAAANGIKPEHFRGGVDLRIHDLRHTFASWQAGQSVSMAIISKSLNHGSLRSTERYAHVAPSPVNEEVANAVRAIADASAAPFKSKVVGLKRAAPKT